MNASFLVISSSLFTDHHIVWRRMVCWQRREMNHCHLPNLNRELCRFITLKVVGQCRYSDILWWGRYWKRNHVISLSNGVPLDVCLFVYDVSVYFVLKYHTEPHVKYIMELHVSVLCFLCPESNHTSCCVYMPTNASHNANVGWDCDILSCSNAFRPALPSVDFRLYDWNSQGKERIFLKSDSVSFAVVKETAHNELRMFLYVGSFECKSQSISESYVFRI
jgi:hypothetical protein